MTEAAGYFLVLLVTALGTPTRADPVVLASVERFLSGAGAPEPEFRVRIVLAHDSVPPPLNEVRLGDDLWWEDGQSGMVDFDIDGDPEFAEFASRLTDGVDEVLFILVEGTRGGGGPGGFESAWLERSPDLVGNQLDFIRLIVENVSLEPWEDPYGGGLGVRHNVDLRYEFWGHPIPEPTSLSLLAIGALALVRRRGSPTSSTRPCSRGNKRCQEEFLGVGGDKGGDKVVRMIYLRCFGGGRVG